MGIYYNPHLSTDELKFYLDASNLKSYPGTGTTFFDLSGNNNDYTMYGTVPLASDGNVKYFDFSGNGSGTTYDAPLGFTRGGGMSGMGLDRVGSFTISYWFRHNGAGGQISLIANAGSADGFRFGPSGNGYYWLMGLNYREGIFGTNTNSGDGNWHYVNGVFDRGNEYNRSGGASVHFYEDGIYLGDVGNFGSQSTMTNGTPTIGRNPCCQRFAGDMSMITWHNKALTSDEAYQNFNALRGRFGI